MGLNPTTIFISLLLAASVSFGATKTKKTVTKLPAKKVTVESTSVEVDVDEDIAAELEEDIQEEPATEVSATPLENSKSANLREKRRQMEIETEEKMVQELESSRIEDEATRRDRVFGDRIQPVGTTEVEVVKAEPAPVPAPAPVINITNEIKTEAAVVETKEESPTSYYLGLTGGLVDARADNVTGAGAAGVGLGAMIPLHSNNSYTGVLGIEGSFLYTLLQGETRTILGNSEYDVDQYHGAVSAKYYIQSGWFVPGAGLIMAYTRRQYNQDDNFSNSIDGGFAVSGDIRLTKSISIGAEYRYMMNLDYERDQAPSSAAVAAQKAVSSKEIKNLEAIDYQMLLINGKIAF